MASGENPNPLCIIPVFVRTDEHVAYLKTCLDTLRDPTKTATKVDILMVDDKSPHPSAKKVIEELAKEYRADVAWKKTNTGFSQTVNVGIKRAHEARAVAVLVNLDMEFVQKDWLQIALDDPGDLIGGRLLYPNLLIQHGGVFFSRLYRWFDHKFRMAPMNLPEANVRCECPVTGALHIIKPHVMDEIGYYDEGFKLAYEDVDYCLRAYFAGLKVVYNPKVVAIHHESIIRGGKSATEKTNRWYTESWQRITEKYAGVDMNPFLLPLDRRRPDGKIPGPTEE